MKKCNFKQCQYDNSIFCIHPKNKAQLCEQKFCPKLKKRK